MRNYTGGMLAKLSEQDIQDALEFGKANRYKPDVISYAYFFKEGPASSLDNAYVLVQTNYYLIAQYAAKQSKEYLPIDMEYVRFLASLPTFYVEVVEDGVVPVERRYALLGNNQRVHSSDVQPSYEGVSPYRATLATASFDFQTTAAQVSNQVIQAAQRVSEAWQKGEKVPRTAFQFSPSNPEHLYKYSDIQVGVRYEAVIFYPYGERRVPIDFSTVK